MDEGSEESNTNRDFGVHLPVFQTPLKRKERGLEQRLVYMCLRSSVMG